MIHESRIMIQKQLPAGSPAGICAGLWKKSADPPAKMPDLMPVLISDLMSDLISELISILSLYQRNESFQTLVLVIQCYTVTVRPPSNSRRFLAILSAKTRVERRSPHSRSEFSMGERKLLI